MLKGFQVLHKFKGAEFSRKYIWNEWKQYLSSLESVRKAKTMKNPYSLIHLNLNRGFSLKPLKNTHKTHKKIDV